MSLKKIDDLPLTPLEWHWVLHYLHPFQVDEITMRPEKEQRRIVRDLISRAKRIYERQIEQRL